MTATTIKPYPERDGDSHLRLGAGLACFIFRFLNRPRQGGHQGRTHQAQPAGALCRRGCISGSGEAVSAGAGASWRDRAAG